MIEVSGLTKIYGDRAAVNGVTFTAERGVIMGFLGPNGAGKSTTMKMITGLVPPDAGTARVAGLDVRSQSLAARRMIGYMPENVPLYRDMLVADYLRFIAEMRDVPRSSRRRRVDEVMDQCGLTGVARRLIANLSKGYQQRVGLAQALVSDPPILILDEPTSGLDPQQIVEIRDLIRSFAGHKTVILSTHILPEVSMTCAQVVIINQGAVIASGPLDQVASGLAGAPPVIVKVRGAKEAIKAVIGDLPGVHDKEISVRMEHDPVDNSITRIRLMPTGGEGDLRPRLAREFARSGVDLLEMIVEKPALEDVYLRAMAGLRQPAGSARP